MKEVTIETLEARIREIEFNLSIKDKWGLKAREDMIFELECYAKLLQFMTAVPVTMYRHHNSYNGMKTDWHEVDPDSIEHLHEVLKGDDNAEIAEFYRAEPKS